MDARARLGEVVRANRQIDALMERRRRCRELAEARGGRPEGLEALERELAERIDGYAALVAGAERRINALESPMQREVLGYRYLNGWSWNAIAARTGYSREWLWRQHALALALIDAAEGINVNKTYNMAGNTEKCGFDGIQLG